MPETHAVVGMRVDGTLSMWQIICDLFGSLFRKVHYTRLRVHLMLSG